MRLRRTLTPLCLIALVLGFWNAVPRADEGFWPFNAIPKAAIKQQYGFEVSDEWLKHLQLSSVRFGGASGSIVSPDGLVLTNHHVGQGALTQLSTPERDYVKNGFLAATRDQELKVPGMELSVLATIEDVTGRVNAAAKPGLTAAEAFAARRAMTAAIERESQSTTGLRSEVVTLYQGALYHLYRYKVYTDVRLVFGVEYQTAFYGGDPDNFTYPRYCLDMTMFRLYEEGKPAKTGHYLRWSAGGSKEGELVFTSGHPGSTQRLNTVAHLEYLRDTGLPFNIKLLERRQSVLRKYGAQGAEETRRAQLELFGIENTLKSIRGQIKGLRDPSLMARKQEAEAKLRQAVEGDAQKQAAFGGAWDAIAAARKTLPAYEFERVFTEGAAGLNTRLFGVARTLVRLAAERNNPEADRLPEYTDARIPIVERGLLTPSPLFADYERAKLADSLAFMQSELGASSPIVTAILGGQTPEERAADLIGGTKLLDLSDRKELLSGGQAAIDASADPLVVLARSLDPMSRALRKKYEDEVTSVERASYAKIAQAVFAVEGGNAYPDATGTLRLSYGAVRSYMEEGRRVAPYTVFRGLYDRSAQHGGQPPYDLSPRWAEKKAELNLKTPFNFVTTNDIVGGNSGSPVVNTKGEIVGLIFDGNIQSLPGYFVFDESVNRAVAIDSRAIVEALGKVYGAGAIVAEMTGRR
jgi:hypothetical protein